MEFSEQFSSFWLPILLLMVTITVFSWWLFCVISKSKFSKKATVYAGRVILDSDENGGYCHKIVGFQKYPLKQYNTASAVLIPNMHPLETRILNIRLTATKSGPMCSELYFLGSVYSEDRHGHWTGTDILNYMEQTSGILKIEEMKNSSADSAERRFLVGNERICYVFPQSKMMDKNGVTHIESATILFYENA